MRPVEESAERLLTDAERMQLLMRGAPLAPGVVAELDDGSWVVVRRVVSRKGHPVEVWTEPTDPPPPRRP